MEYRNPVQQLDMVLALVCFQGLFCLHVARLIFSSSEFPQQLY